MLGTSGLLSAVQMGYSITHNASFSVEVDRVLSVYQAKLRNIFELIELDGASAIEALRREAWRIAPASTSFDATGNGARDAAIWLSLINESVRSGETIYFVSSDKRAFKADQCSIDINETGAAVHVVDNIGELLELLADDVAVEVDPTLIEKSRAARQVWWTILIGLISYTTSS